MSYQEYAQLGKARANHARGGSDSIERPYTGTHSSFSVPRRSPPGSVLHSSSDSTSTVSLSPSSSASQQNPVLSPSVSGGRAAGAGQRRLREIPIQEEKKPDLVEVPLPWRPFYLGRRILIAFIVIFIGLIITLEALLQFSNRNAGLGNANQVARYAWQYVPVAVLTVTAALWNRVDFQAKSAAPWIRMSRGPADVDRTLLLDYVSMFHPLSVVKALQHGDFLVACTSSISLIFKALIIISTSIVTVGFVDVPAQHSPITFQTSFVNTSNALATAGSLPFYTMVGLLQDNLSFPDGSSQQFAYRSFVSSYDIGESAQIRSTADGFSAWLDCQEATLDFAGAQYHHAFEQLNITFRAPGCDVYLPITQARPGFVGAVGANSSTPYFGRIDHAGCNNSTDMEDQRIVVVFGQVDIPTSARPQQAFIDNIPMNGSIPVSAQFVCKPAYSIMNVDVAKNGTTLVNISMSDSPQNRTLANVQPWDIAQAFFESYNSLLESIIAVSPDYQPHSAVIDAPTALMISMLVKSRDKIPDLTVLFDPATLYEASNSYFTTYAALMARQSLLRADSVPAVGSATINISRLVVGTLAVQLTVALLGVSLIAAVASCFLVPTRGFLPRDPNTIIDTAVLIAHSRPLLQCLRGAGGADASVIRERLEGSSYYVGAEAYDQTSALNNTGFFKIFGGFSSDNNPEYVQPSRKWPFAFGLHPLQRVAALIVVIALIAVLEVTLRISDGNDGFADVGDDTYLHYLWTAVPAIVLTAVAMFFSSADFNTRALAPYAHMTKGASFRASASLNFLDKTTPVVLFEALGIRDIAVVATTAAVLTASFLTIFTASLFSTVAVPVTGAVQLLSEDYFAQNGFPPANKSDTGNSCIELGCQNDTVVPSLVLNANLSYPAFTYQDMAFPSLRISDLLSNLLLPDDARISAIIPAVRSSVNCTIYPQSKLTTNLTLNTFLNQSQTYVNPLSISIPGDVPFTIELSTAHGANGVKEPTRTSIDPNAFFGATSENPINGNTSTFHDPLHWAYAWGRLSSADSNSTTLKVASAASCVEVLQDIDVNVTFVGSDLAIDPANPPVYIEGSARQSLAALPASLGYRSLVNVSTAHLFDEFFSSLVASRFAVPMESLESTSPAVQQSVADAIAFQQSIIRAQAISVKFRRPTTTNASYVPLTNSGELLGNATQMTYPATVTNAGVGARRRVVQDTTSTRVLQSLLGAILLTSIVAWIAFPRPNILPRPPTSIANVAALLADGNVFGFLGRSAEWQSAEEVRGMFKDGLHVTAGLKLGWEDVRRRRREQTLATWGMNGNCPKEQAFSISVMRTGGWGGGENVGLGLQARVGYAQRGYVRDWGWRS